MVGLKGESYTRIGYYLFEPSLLITLTNMRRLGTSATHSDKTKKHVPNLGHSPLDNCTYKTKK